MKIRSFSWAQVPGSPSPHSRCLGHVLSPVVGIGGNQVKRRLSGIGIIGYKERTHLQVHVSDQLLDDEEGEFCNILPFGAKYITKLCHSLRDPVLFFILPVPGHLIQFFPDQNI